MSSCCGPLGHDEIFNQRFASSVAARYRRRGLTPAEQQIVRFLSSGGIDGATVLEIGGGVGEIQVELLRAGATHVTNVELVGSYEAEAARLLQAEGLASRATRLQLDFAVQGDRVPPADVVVLHRVVCCYPDHQALLTAAANHARRSLVFTHPPRNLASRLLVWMQNLAFRVTGHAFNSHLHPPAEMLAVLARQGLEPVYRHRGPIWRVIGLQRSATAVAPAG